MNLSDLNLPEQQIRELAYQIWESEGKPHGQAARHWDIACKLAAESLAPAPAAIAKKTRARKSAAAPETQASDAATPIPAKAPRSRKASASQAGEAEAPAVKPPRKTKVKSLVPDVLVPDANSLAPGANRAEPEAKNTEPQLG